jgi:hypothetical protein
MTSNKNYWLSLTLIICALICQFTGTSQAGATAKARAISLRLPPEQVGEFKAQAARKAEMGLVIVFVGYLLAIASLVFCWLSAKYKESISRAVPIALLVCFFLSQFLLI